MPEKKSEPALAPLSGGGGSFGRSGPDIDDSWGLALGAGLLPEKTTKTEKASPEEVEELDVEDTDEDLDEQQRFCPPGCRRYVVGAGETLFSIARRLGVSVNDIIACNPNLPDPNRIFPGQVICVPRRAVLRCPPGFRRYRVRPGDTLFSIATRFGTTVTDLLRANPQITDPNLIFPGQIICVPSAGPIPGVCPAGCSPYVVGVGETIFSIAQRLGVSVSSVLACNPGLVNPDLIFPGQTICVPAGAMVRCPAGFQTYTVRPGDTLSSIARQFSTTVAVLLQANPFIVDPNRIFPGQVICVPSGGPIPGVCPTGCQPYVVGVGETLASIARRLGVRLRDVLACNPSLPDPNRIFPGQTVCVPTGVVFPCPPGFTTYTIRAGDTLSSIARRFGTTVAVLLQANPFIVDPNRIFPGQVICVPALMGGAQEGLEFAEPSPAYPTPATEGGFGSEDTAAAAPQQLCPAGFTTYTVVAGDTLFFLARRFGTTVDVLLRANPQITDPNRLSIGQVICVPSGAPTPPPGVTCPAGFTTHTVVAGETLFMIARRFGITVSELLAANPQITDPNNLMVGQVICVPSQPTCPPGSTTYVVRSGDTMFSIAQRFGIPLDVLIRANPHILDPSRLSPGDVLCIPPRQTGGGMSMTSMEASFAESSGTPTATGSETFGSSDVTDTPPPTA